MARPIAGTELSAAWVEAAYVKVTQETVISAPGMQSSGLGSGMGPTKLFSFLCTCHLHVWFKAKAK